MVALAQREDGLIFVQSVTPALRSGEVFHLDLNDTDDYDWTDLSPVSREAPK